MTLPDNGHSIVPLVFTVAITGHQDIDPALHDALRAQVRTLLEDARAGVLGGKASNAIDAGREVSFRFVSALAPGADQIGARAALDLASAAPDDPQGWRLHAVLPFARDTCARLAAAALRTRGLEPAAAEPAVAAIAELADKADRVLELADWQPSPAPADSDAARNDGYWQSRRYATLGQLLVRQADLLIALWDGAPPNGPGGTADVVSEARRSGVPVVWIDRAVPHEVRSVVPDPASSHLTASDLVARWRLDRASATGAQGGRSRFDECVIAGADAAIDAAIAHVLLGKNPERAVCIGRYLAEAPAELWTAMPEVGKEPLAAAPGDRFRAYARLLYWFLKYPTTAKRSMREGRTEAGKPAPDLRSYPFRKARRGASGWARRVLLYPFDPGVAQDQPGTANAAPLLEHARRADALGTLLGNQYRSAYVLIFALAPVAVSWAVISTQLPAWKPLLVALELITVLAAVRIYLRTSASDPVSRAHALPQWIVRIGAPGRLLVRIAQNLRKLLPRRQDTHQRWLDARLIAESQRSGQLLAWAGFVGRRPLEEPSARTSHDDDAHQHVHAPPRTLWAPHYANAIAALPELPGGEASEGNSCAMTPLRVMQVAQAAALVIDHQWDYHDLNHQRLERLNHRLDTFSLQAIIVAFGLSLLYLMCYLFYYLPVHPTEGTPSYLPYGVMKFVAAYSGAVLPAVAAAAAGIRFQGDFERFALRSKDTASRLAPLGERARNLEARARNCSDAPCVGQPPLFEPLLALLLDAQAVLDEDLADWRFAYAARPITMG